MVIERHGRAVAVVISEEDYKELSTIKLQHLRAEIELGIASWGRGSLAEYGTDGLAQLGGRIRATGRKRFSDKRAVVAQLAMQVIP